MSDLTMHASDTRPSSEPGTDGHAATGTIAGLDNTGSAEWLNEVEVHGTCPDRFSAVRDAFAANLNSGADVGASAAVFIEGEPVVDLWGGSFDMSYTRPWERDTIVHTFSSTKTMTALCALILADRGEIDLDAPVSKYWPEFAENGKADVLVRHIVSHTSGLAGWSEPVTMHDLCDREKSTALLARQAPWWEPGTAAGYHCFTIGHLVGEVVRRVTGLTLGTFFAREVAAKVGAEFSIGTGPEHDHRVSNLIPGTPAAQATGQPYYDRACFNPPVTPHDAATIPWRRAEVGAVNGHGNARGIAAAQSVLAAGGVGSVRVMSEAGRERVLQLQAAGPDLVFGLAVRWGVGYSLSPLVPAAAGSRTAFWGGNGGSMSYVDLDRRLSFGYAQNRWVRGAHELDRSRSILQALYASLAR